jgi:putative FmdB family regulatory protein
MPIYEFQCWGCNEKSEELRKLGDYAPAKCPVCGGATEHIISASTMQVWNQERKFPNIRKDGDGAMSFNSKSDYKAYLKETHQAESSHDAPVVKPHGNKVIARYK